jgi:hypothetical protein
MAFRNRQCASSVKKAVKIFLAGQFDTLQRTNIENSKEIFQEKESRGHSPRFHIHVSVSDLYIPTIDLPSLL